MSKFLKITLFLTCLMVVIGFLTFGKFEDKALAQSGKMKIVGQMWSPNIGWIDTGAPGETKYGLTLDPSTRTIRGSAWSNNIGWISFNPDDVDDECPNGAGVSYDATGKLAGYARARVGTDAQGWDGCINFGTGGSDAAVYNLSTGKFSGAAWGDKNVGWLTFEKMETIAPQTFSCADSLSGPATVNPIGTTMCAGDNIGLTATTTWKSVLDASSCTEAAKCQYYTVAPQFSCTGNFENASMCTNDNTGLTGDAIGTLAAACSIPQGSAPKCQYVCNSGYSLEGGACVNTGGGPGGPGDDDDDDPPGTDPLAYECTLSPAETSIDSTGKFYVNRAISYNVYDSEGNAVSVSGISKTSGSPVTIVGNRLVYTTVGVKTLPTLSLSGESFQCKYNNSGTITVISPSSTGEN